MRRASRWEYTDCYRNSATSKYSIRHYTHFCGKFSLNTHSALLHRGRTVKLPSTPASATRVPMVGPVTSRQRGIPSRMFNIALSCLVCHVRPEKTWENLSKCLQTVRFVTAMKFYNWKILPSTAMHVTVQQCYKKHIRYKPWVTPSKSTLKPSLQTKYSFSGWK